VKGNILILCIIALFTFSSCEKCKDCDYTYQFINGNDGTEADAIAILLGYSSWDDWWTSQDSLQQLNKEYCDDELEDKEDIEYKEELGFIEDGVDDIRMYFDCK
tara:strand:+ start:50 stop:361 length:312 start_codon:yes stop_codon:yes gene_type:complete